MGKKYYAVRNGRNTGIYNTWSECKSQVDGYSRSSFKSFSTKSEAQAYMNGGGSSNSSYGNYSSNRSSYGGSSNNYNSYKRSSYTPSYSNNYGGSSSSSSSHRNSYGGGGRNKATAYVDGSYNNSTGEYGSGTVIFHNSNEYRIKEKNNDPTYSSMRNVAGELQAAKNAMEYCVNNNVTELDLNYDFTGVKEWATGNWKTNKPGTIQYKQDYDNIKDKVNVNFNKVKAHSNNKYNDVADRLAKSAVGIYK